MNGLEHIINMFRNVSLAQQILIKISMLPALGMCQNSLLYVYNCYFYKVSMSSYSRDAHNHSFTETEAMTSSLDKIFVTTTVELSGELI